MPTENDDLNAWLRSNENDVRGIVKAATDEFHDVMVEQARAEVLGAAADADVMVILLSTNI